MKIEMLSYPLSSSTPLYGGASGVLIEPDKCMMDGDSCNTMQWSFPNHSGTHVDAPLHFNVKGKSLSDISPDFWIFNQVEVLDVSELISDGQLVSELMMGELQNWNAELLLIKTNWGKYRGTKKYTLTPPGISSELAPWLRKKMPFLRCVGMDLISISSFANRMEGRLAHKAFLSPEEGKPILLIEDLSLSQSKTFKQVIVAPLIVEGADGAPCTVFGLN